MTAEVLAALVGCTKRSINQLASKKILHRSPGGRFSLEDNVPLCIAHREQAATKAAGATGPYAEARADATLERAKMLRLQRLKIEGELVPLKDMRFTTASAFAIVRAKILGRSNALAPRLAHKSAVDCFQIMSAYDKETLEELADVDFDEALADLARSHGYSVADLKSHTLKFEDPPEETMQ